MTPAAPYAGWVPRSTLGPPRPNLPRSPRRTPLRAPAVLDAVLVGLALAVPVGVVMVAWVIPALVNAVLGGARDLDGRLRAEDAYMQALCTTALDPERDEQHLQRAGRRREPAGPGVIEHVLVGQRAEHRVDADGGDGGGVPEGGARAGLREREDARLGEGDARARRRVDEDAREHADLRVDELTRDPLDARGAAPPLRRDRRHRLRRGARREQYE